VSRSVDQARSIRLLIIQSRFATEWCRHAVKVRVRYWWHRYHRAVLCRDVIRIEYHQGPHSLAQASPNSSPQFAMSGPVPESVLADLPKMEAAGLQWIGIAKLNVRAKAGTSMLAGQPILLLTPTLDEGYHTLAGQFSGLNKSQAYRITAWVKPEAGGNIELEVVDNPDASPVNHAVGIFDLTRHVVLFGSGGIKERGIEQTPGDWQKVWLDLVTSDGKFVFTIRPSNGAADIFKGDGRFGLTLGGIEAEPNS
jgi:hypothetical protein